MQSTTVRTKRIAAAALILLLCAPLAACSSGLAGSSDMPQSAGGRDSIELQSTAYDGAAESAMSTSEADAQRSVINNGDITIEVDDAVAARDEVASIVAGLGGRVESQTVSGNDASSAYLTVRVPADRFDAAFVALSEVGEVLNESRSSSDVTMEHVDLQARVEALEASIDRLTELMQGAATTGELIEAESALSQRQAELDSLRAQLTYLESQIDESAIWVSLQTKSALPGGPANFWDGLLAGLHSLSAAGAGALVLLGVLLPWLVLAGLVTLVIVLSVRASRRRRVARAQRQAETAAPGQVAESPGAEL